MPRQGRVSGLEQAKMASSESSCSDATGGESIVPRQVARRVSGSIICLVATISFIFATAVVLLVILTKLREKQTPIIYSGDSPHCIDVAVIGGGLAGSYTTWRLQQRDLSVHIYEMSNRIGGRLYTRTFPNIPEIKLEVGGAYYVPTRHRRMEALVRSLGLRVKKQAMPQDISYYIRDMFVTQEDLNTTDGLYHLDMTEHSILPRDLLRRILEHRTATLKYESLRDALVEGASPEAFRLLEATLPPTIFHADGNAQVLFSSMTSPDWAADATEDSGRVTLADGMDALPRTLVSKALSQSDKVRLHLGLRLKKLTRSDGVYKLEFIKTATNTPNNATVCARRVVLALPPEALHDIEWQPLEEASWLKTNLRSVTSVPATKVFLAFPKAGPTDRDTTTANADNTTSTATYNTTQPDTIQNDTTDYDTSQNDVTNYENDTTGDVEFATTFPSDTNTTGSETTAAATTIDTTTVAGSTITTLTTTDPTTVTDPTAVIDIATNSVNTTDTNTSDTGNNDTNVAISNATYDVTVNGSDATNMSLSTRTTPALLINNDTTNETTHDCAPVVSTTVLTLAPASIRVRTDMPMRYIEDLTSSANDVTTSTVLQAVFASGPHAVYWDNLLGGATFAGSLSSNADSVSEKLVKYLRAYLKRLAPVMEVIQTALPSDAVIQRWSASLPSGGAWHAWKPSFNWRQVSHRMLRPIPDDKIFIVGSAFATGHLQMYAEGALQTVDDMLVML